MKMDRVAMKIDAEQRRQRSFIARELDGLTCRNRLENRGQSRQAPRVEDQGPPEQEDRLCPGDRQGGFGVRI
jgi:hypothetical protein